MPEVWCEVCGERISSWQGAVCSACHHCIVEEERKKAEESAFERGYEAGEMDTVAKIEEELERLDLCPRCRELKESSSRRCMDRGRAPWPRGKRGGAGLRPS